MSTILFVNACMRGNDSRTLSLCKEYLATKTSDVIEEVNLDKLALSPLSGSSAAYRMEKQAKKAWDDPIFTYAKQMVEADEIVIGAPYWDLSFPAALKTYTRTLLRMRYHFSLHSRRTSRGLMQIKNINLHNH